MAQVRPLPQLRRRYQAINSILMVIAISSFAYVFFQAAHRDTLFYVVAGLFVASSISCLVLDRLMIRTIACPTCGTLLSREKAPRGKFISIQFRCEKCQTIWDTQATTHEPIEYSDPL